MDRSDKMRVVTSTVTIVTVLVLIAATVVAAIYVPQVAVYVPIIALGLALALQKFTASIIAFFVIEFTRVFEIGDRIRIGNVKGDVRHVGLIHIVLEEVGPNEYSEPAGGQLALAVHGGYAHRPGCREAEGTDGKRGQGVTS